jgi:hypothetical protein
LTTIYRDIYALFAPILSGAHEERSGGSAKVALACISAQAEI